MSEFKMVRPVAITGSNLMSNIPETGNEFSPNVGYGKGAQVLYSLGASATHHRYESLVANNLGNALTDDTKWLDLGATNRWAMFDGANGTQSQWPSTIDVTIPVIGRVDALGLLNLDAEEVQVTMTVGGVVVFDQTLNLVSTENITDWFAYFSEDIVYRNDIVVTDLPLFTNPTVRVQARKDSGTVGIGQMVLGQTRTLGEVVYGGAGIGIQDFSRKVEDADFGTAELKRRGYAKRGDFKIVMPEVTADSAARLLADYRATNVLWIADEAHSSTIIFGWVKDWGLDFTLWGQSQLTVQIEGII